MNKQKVINLKEEEEKLIQADQIIAQSVSFLGWQQVKKAARLNTLFQELEKNEPTEELVSEIELIKSQFDEINNRLSLEIKESESLKQKFQNLYKLKEKSRLQAALRKINSWSKKLE